MKKKYFSYNVSKASYGFKLLSDDILEIFTDQNKLSSIHAQDKHIA